MKKIPTPLDAVRPSSTASDIESFRSTAPRTARQQRLQERQQRRERMAAARAMHTPGSTLTEATAPIQKPRVQAPIRRGPVQSPDTVSQARVAQTANVERGAAPTGGMGTRERRSLMRSARTGDVAKLQRQLASLGFDISVDGIMGPQTMAAYRRAVDGAVNSERAAINYTLTQPRTTASRTRDIRNFGPGAAFDLDMLKAKRDDQLKALRDEYNARPEVWLMRRQADAQTEVPKLLAERKALGLKANDITDFSRGEGKALMDRLNAIDAQIAEIRKDPALGPRLMEMGVLPLPDPSWSEAVTSLPGQAKDMLYGFGQLAGGLAGALGQDVGAGFGTIGDAGRGQSRERDIGHTERFTKAMAEAMALDYKNRYYDTWRNGTGESTVKRQSLSYILDITALVNAVGRVGGVGAALKSGRLRAPTRMGRIREAINNSYHPPEPRWLKSETGILIGRVPSRSPIGRAGQRLYDYVSAKYPTAHVIGMDRRVGRALGRRVKRVQGRETAQAWRDILLVHEPASFTDHVSPHVRAAARTRLYWESQGLDLNDLVDDLTAQKQRGVQARYQTDHPLRDEMIAAMKQGGLGDDDIATVLDVADIRARTWARAEDRRKSAEFWRTEHRPLPDAQQTNPSDWWEQGAFGGKLRGATFESLDTTPTGRRLLSDANDDPFGFFNQRPDETPEAHKARLNEWVSDGLMAAYRQLNPEAQNNAESIARLLQQAGADIDGPHGAAIQALGEALRQGSTPETILRALDMQLHGMSIDGVQSSQSLRDAMSALHSLKGGSELTANDVRTAHALLEDLKQAIDAGDEESVRHLHSMLNTLYRMDDAEIARFVREGVTPGHWDDILGDTPVAGFGDVHEMSPEERLLADVENAAEGRPTEHAGPQDTSHLRTFSDAELDARLAAQARGEHVPRVSQEPWFQFAEGTDPTIMEAYRDGRLAGGNDLGLIQAIRAAVKVDDLRTAAVLHNRLVRGETYTLFKIADNVQGDAHLVRYLSAEDRKKATSSAYAGRTLYTRVGDELRVQNLDEGTSAYYRLNLKSMEYDLGRTRTQATPTKRDMKKLRAWHEAGRQGVPGRLDYTGEESRRQLRPPRTSTDTLRLFKRAGEPYAGFYTKTGRWLEEQDWQSMKIDSLRNKLSQAGISKEEMEWLRVPEFFDRMKSEGVQKIDKQALLDWIDPDSEGIRVVESGADNPHRPYIEQEGTYVLRGGHVGGRALSIHLDPSKYGELYSGSHVPEFKNADDGSRVGDNIIAWIRFNERHVEGQRALFIEEIQSDWHQSGQDRGYVTAEAERELGAARKAFDDADAEYQAAYSTHQARVQAFNNLLQERFNPSRQIPDIAHATPEEMAAHQARVRELESRVPGQEQMDVSGGRERVWATILPDAGDYFPEGTKIGVENFSYGDVTGYTEDGTRYDLSPRYVKFEDPYIEWARERAYRESQELDVLNQARSEASDRLYQAQTAANGVANGPFKQFQELALKRMLKWAVDNGYERIAWTDGLTQALRNHHGREIDRLEFFPETGKVIGYKGTSHSGTYNIGTDLAGAEKKLSPFTLRRLKEAIEEYEKQPKPEVEPVKPEFDPADWTATDAINPSNPEDFRTAWSEIYAQEGHAPLPVRVTNANGDVNTILVSELYGMHEGYRYAEMFGRVLDGPLKTVHGDAPVWHSFHQMFGQEGDGGTAEILRPSRPNMERPPLNKTTPEVGPKITVEAPRMFMGDKTGIFRFYDDLMVKFLEKYLKKQGGRDLLKRRDLDIEHPKSGSQGGSSGTPEWTTDDVLEYWRNIGHTPETNTYYTVEDTDYVRRNIDEEYGLIENEDGEWVEDENADQWHLIRQSEGENDEIIQSRNDRHHLQNQADEYNREEERYYAESEADWFNENPEDYADRHPNYDPDAEGTPSGDVEDNQFEPTGEKVPVNSLEVTKDVADFVRGGQSLFAKEGGRPLAAVDLSPEGAYIRIFQGTNAAAVLHELVGHGFRHELDPTDMAHLETAAHNAGVTLKDADGKYSIDFEEWIAEQMENYLAGADAPTHAVRQVFERLRALFTRLYQRLRPQVNNEIKPLFDKYFGGDEPFDVQADDALDMHRRNLNIDNRLREINEAAKYKPDERYNRALEATRQLSNEIERQLLEFFGDSYEDVLRQRRGLFGDPEGAMIPHRAEADSSVGGMRAPTTQHVGRLNTAKLRMNKANNLILYRDGRLVADPDLLIQHYFRVQSLRFAQAIRDSLASGGIPIPRSGPNPGWYVVNPKGKPRPRWWGDAEWISDSTMTDNLEEAFRSFVARWDPGAEEDTSLLRDPFTGEFLPDVVQVPPEVVEALYMEVSGATKRPKAGDIVGLGSETRKTMNLIGNLVRIGVLYSNPGYYPTNFLGNLIYLGLHEGVWAPWNLYRAAKIHHSDPQLWDMIHAEVGSGRTQAGLKASPAFAGKQKLGQFESRKDRWNERVLGVAKVAGSIPDDWPRAAAFIHEAHKLGFETPEQIKDLLMSNTPHTMHLKEMASERATEAMVNFDRLRPWERQFIQTVFFVWPWIRGSTAWIGRFIREYPERAALVANASARAQENADTVLGDRPVWAQGLVPLGGAEGDKVNVMNFGGSSPTGTAADLLGTIQGLSKSQAPDYQRLFDMLNPLLSGAVLTSRGEVERGSYLENTGYRTAAEENLGWELFAPFRLVRELLSPDKYTSDIYADQSAEGVAWRRTLRFWPQEASLKELHARGTKAETKSESQRIYDEIVKDATEYFVKENGMAAVPADILRAARNRRAVNLGIAALKAEVEGSDSYQPAKPTQREAHLTPRQLAGIKLAVFAQHLGQYPPDTREENRQLIQALTKSIITAAPDDLAQINNDLDYFLGFQDLEDFRADLNQIHLDKQVEKHLTKSR